MPVLPEIPQEWYTTEIYHYSEWWESGKGVRMIMKKEYQHLFEYCTMLNIPFEIDGVPVKSFSVSSAPKEEISLMEIGFRNLKILQYSLINSEHIYGLELEELISLNQVYNQSTRKNTIKRRHISEACVVLHEVAFRFAENGQDWIRIPASVKLIGWECGETDLEGFSYSVAKNYVVDGNNTNYYSLFGVLFSYPFERIGSLEYMDYITGSSGANILLSYPPEKNGIAYKVPDGVQKIEDFAFNCANNLKKLFCLIV